MTHWQVLPLTGALLLVGAAPAAAAEEPERTAWYSAASGGGLVASQPAADEGDLKVTRAAGTEAFSTLLYRAEGVRASLDLTLRDTGAGTPDVVACPTVGEDWEAGGNQPLDAAPEVDCSLSMAFAVLSEDGLQLSFSLDQFFQTSPGTWSIALVPAPGAASPGPPPKVPLPFSVDIAEPEPGAFVVEAAFVLPDLTSEPDGTTSTPDGSDTAGGSGDAFFPGSFAAPPSVDSGSAGTTDTPLLAGGDSAPLPDAAAPDPAVAAPAPAGPPVLRTQPAGIVEDVGTGRRLLGLLVLAGGSAAVGYAAGQQRPGPRLIGGRARALPAAAAVPAAVPAPAEERPRGIGRFARVRDAAPRRLR